MHSGRRLRVRRILAALLAASFLPLATPSTAWAREESDNLWAQWWKGVTDRSQKAEIPFVFLVSIPAMIVVTPIWLVERGFARVFSDGDDEEDADS